MGRSSTNPHNHDHRLIITMAAIKLFPYFMMHSIYLRTKFRLTARYVQFTRTSTVPVIPSDRSQKRAGTQLNTIHIYTRTLGLQPHFAGIPVNANATTTILIAAENQLKLHNFDKPSWKSGLSITFSPVIIGVLCFLQN